MTGNCSYAATSATRAMLVTKLVSATRSAPVRPVDTGTGERRLKGTSAALVRSLHEPEMRLRADLVGCQLHGYTSPSAIDPLINCTSISRSSSAQTRSAVIAGMPSRRASARQERSPRDRPLCVVFG